MSGSDSSWTTNDEILFMKRICLNPAFEPKKRLDQLRIYKVGMNARSNWGKIDRQAVETVLDNEIANALQLVEQTKAVTQKG